MCLDLAGVDGRSDQPTEEAPVGNAVGVNRFRNDISGAPEVGGVELIKAAPALDRFLEEGGGGTERKNGKKTTMTMRSKAERVVNALVDQ